MFGYKSSYQFELLQKFEYDVRGIFFLLLMLLSFFVLSSLRLW
jgi:hypothetical protein